MTDSTATLDLGGTVASLAAGSFLAAGVVIEYRGRRFWVTRDTVVGKTEGSIKEDEAPIAPPVYTTASAGGQTDRYLAVGIDPGADLVAIYRALGVAEGMLRNQRSRALAEIARLQDPRV